MEFASPEAEQRYDAVAAAAPGVIVALDFDGTLSPIVDDPARARIHPDAGEVLVALAQKVLAVAVVTGRPARQVLDLGGLEEVGDGVTSNVFTVRGLAGTSARFVDPRALVCSGGVCPLVVGDQVVFYDDDHITASWSRLVAPALAELTGPLVTATG